MRSPHKIEMACYLNYCKCLVEPYEIKPSLDSALALASEVYGVKKFNFSARN